MTESADVEWEWGWPQWIAVVCWRALWALVIVRTAFVPDEYWQSVEVAHYMVFGQGDLTWEWTRPDPIRSVAYPGLLFAPPLFVLRVLGLDYPWAVVAAPLCVQALIGAMGDWLVWRLARTCFGEEAAAWTLLLHLTSWGTLYCWARTLSNTLEALFVLATLVSLLRPERIAIGVALITACATVRPPSALPWLVWLVAMQQRSIASVVLRTIPAALAVVGANAVLDGLFFGRFSLPWIHFLLFNIGDSAHYGAHPWHWYATSGLPQLFATNIPLAIIGVGASPRAHRWPAWLFLLIVPIAHSFVAHKEFRFLLPSLSVAIVYAGLGMATLLRGVHVRSWRTVLVVACILLNLSAAAYLCHWHQRGPVAITDALRVRLRPGDCVSMLVPCHSVPAHARLHAANVSLHHLRCDPGTAMDSSDIMFADPSVERVKDTLARWGHCRFVVAFAPLDEVMEAMGMRREGTWFHAHFPSDSRHGNFISLWTHAP